ncbi:DUF4209 domain-containing protein [Pasteurella dagmatis]|uniref:Uncharacterized protein n=1 Tax=Pasteurella dagmatis ATCC 43325 TaxID=667128 RepID=C9PSB7_9PAST|nr:DUF4209 domain-containing protein [Pasteurella dagmatis]EEX49536.1 hypothetical protein HMPREF0621_1891 [Pasteurella dagmatis ATCC 43325]SNV83560.1 Uncharacterised protein [Pasteurella dagmatis]
MPNLEFCEKEILKQKCTEVFSLLKRPNEPYSVFEIASAFSSQANKEKDKKIAETLTLLAKVTSPTLQPTSRNEPFIASCSNPYPIFTPTLLTSEELDSLADILEEIEQPILKARIADILWIYAKPKKREHCITAIKSYLAIEASNNFSYLDIYDLWERASYLSVSLKDQTISEEIKNKLVLEFEKDSIHWDFHQLRISEIVLNTGLDNSILQQLGEKLLKIALPKFENPFNAKNEYISGAKSIFEKIQNSEKIAECDHLLGKLHEEQGDLNKSHSNITANHNYRQALLFYRKIPKRYRNKFCIDDTKLNNLINRINTSAQSMIDEFTLVKTPEIDVSKLKQVAIAHVANKNDISLALGYFSGISSCNLNNILQQTEDIARKTIFQNLASYSCFSSDGRLIQEIQPLTQENKEQVLFQKAIHNFPMHIGFEVITSIKPAFMQLQNEYAISKEILISLCKHSRIVPDNRVISVAEALFQGFEYNFGNAIHLLTPQVENIVRQYLKNNGVITTHTDPDGKENERSLSSLLDDEQSRNLLGDDLWFELQAVFTHPLGANLRNKVAHGLLNDEDSNSYTYIYAWWMVLRIIIRNI